MPLRALSPSSPLISAELEKQKGVVRPSTAQCSSLRKEPGSSALSRACLDDSYASSEGLKRSALSSSLRDLSEAGKDQAGEPPSASDACGTWVGHRDQSCTVHWDGTAVASRAGLRQGPPGFPSQAPRSQQPLIR